MKYLVLVVFSGLLGCTSEVRKCNTIKNDQGNYIKWNKSFPINITLDESAVIYRQPIIDAINQWNLSANKEIVRLTEGDSPNLIYLNYEVPEVKDWQAVTHILWRGTDIVDASVRIYVINIDYINIESLMIHELGHFLGLNHSHVRPSVMYSYLSPGEDRTEITKEDLNNLTCLYPELETTK